MVRAALALVVRRCCHIYVIVIVLARLDVFVIVDLLLPYLAGFMFNAFCIDLQCSLDVKLTL